MEEFADAKEDENKKILHTYPLVRVSAQNINIVIEEQNIIYKYYHLIIGLF